MVKESEVSAYLRKNFPKISEAKKKGGNFIGPQIKILLKDHTFSTELNTTERRAWEASENICRNFLGNEKTETYTEIVQELISSYAAVGCNVIKTSFSV
jgi:hypothetical protein